MNCCGSPSWRELFYGARVTLDAARRWVNLAAELHRELREVAELGSIDPRWWVLAAGAALPWARGSSYVISDAEPAADTFIGHAAPPSGDPIRDAIARAHAARSAIRELDGKLPGQPLAVTIQRDAMGARVVANDLEVAAFAIGDRCYLGRIDDPELANQLAHPHRLPALDREIGRVPFITITLGSEPLATARHGHRRAWTERDGVGAGPWLGLSRSEGLELVTTCHMVVDGYGHGLLATAIRTASAHEPSSGPRDHPPPAIPLDATALDVAWAELAVAPRALELAYRLGCALHRRAADRTARFSPTFQIPVAPGARDDADRFARRVVPAIASVRFTDGQPEPLAHFTARTKQLLAREAAGTGVSGHLLAAAQAAPVPLAWKRRAVGTARPPWLEAMANLIGGRGCVSKIPGESAVAVSSPARLATASDPLGSCVVTLLGDVLTVTASGLDARALLAELRA